MQKGPRGSFQPLSGLMIISIQALPFVRLFPAQSACIPAKSAPLLSASRGKMAITNAVPRQSFDTGAICLTRKRLVLIKIDSAVRTAAGAMLLAAASALAQQAAPAPQAPVPPAILQAKRIFLSNAGGDSGLFPSPFSGDPNRGYNQFYAGLRANGQYQLVDDPSEADLVLELQLTAPMGSTRSMDVNKINGASDPVPMFRLALYDRKTHYILWVLTQSIEVAFLQKTHDRNFDDALTALLLEFESLSGKAQSVTH